MKKIEYGDVNKFLVSIGIVLVTLAILAPYLFLKEDFGLYLEQEKLMKLQDPIKALIKDKQNKIILIQEYLPLISLTLLGLGALSIIVGLFRWFRRQSKIDEKFDKEIVKLDLEVTALRPEEIKRKAEDEASEIEAEEGANSTSPTITTSNIYREYLRIEDEITSVFERYNSRNFKVLSQQKIGDRFEVDLILRATSTKFSDRIVEIKYFRSSVHLTMLQRSLFQLSKLSDYYKDTTNKLLVPVLLIVYKSENITGKKLTHYKERLLSYSKEIEHLDRIKIEFINEIDIDKYDVKRILKR